MYSLKTEKLKSTAKRRMRDFFDSKNFTEVDTPIMSETTIPEHTIELFSTLRHGEFTAEKTMYLLPSPELYMKKILCRYNESIYEICKAFRNSEQDGRIHNNEFTMLEFYMVDATYRDTIKLTDEMLKEVFYDSESDILKANGKIITASDLLQTCTGYSLKEIHQREALDEISSRFSLSLPEGESFDDTFNRIFIHIIEPVLKDFRQPVYITDYPAEIECLARQNGITRERFEMYVGGTEIANGYTEMTDLNEIKRLFASEKNKIQNRAQKCDDLLQQMPMCKSSGVAIGFDRLFMTAYGISDIRDTFITG